MKTSTHFITFFVIFAALIPSSSMAGNTKHAYSTSNLIAVNYINGDGDTVKTKDGKAALNGGSYVTLRIEKFRANKSIGKIESFFNKKKNAFAGATFRATYDGNPLANTRVGQAVKMSKSMTTVDLGTSWNILTKVPWNLKNANIEFNIGYSSKSSVKAIVDAFSQVTSGTTKSVSENLTTGLSIVSAIDKLIFDSNRDLYLLHSSIDIPLGTGELTDGVYVVFAAEKPSQYEKYFSDRSIPLVWDSTILKYQNEAVKDVSYIVVRVIIEDKKYENVAHALNDTANWAKYYNVAINSLPRLAFVDTDTNLDKIKSEFKQKINEAKVLLDNDITFLEHEREAIDLYAVSKINRIVVELEKRQDDSGDITKESTLKVVKALSEIPDLFDEQERKMLFNILNQPIIPEGVNAGILEDNYMDALMDIRNSSEHGGG